MMTSGLPVSCPFLSRGDVKGNKTGYDDEDDDVEEEEAEKREDDEADFFFIFGQR